MSKSNKKIYQFGGGAYIEFANAAVVITDSREMFSRPDPLPVPLVVGDEKIAYRGMVPWGISNNLPGEIIAKVGASVDMSTNMLFNISAGYGDGILPVRITYDQYGKKTVIPVKDNPDINSFFENNDIGYYLQEQLTDMNYFYQLFPEILLNTDVPQKRKVVELTSKEAAFSRWEEMNPDTGYIENHFYSSMWEHGMPKPNEIVATKVLHPKNTILDLKRRIGREPYLINNKLKTIDEKCYRYIIPLRFPTPGNFYYPNPYWDSLFKSGWYDYALLIPEFKKALLNNQMMLKYMVYINKDYFPKIFADEGKKLPEEQKKRINQEYQNIGNYLSGAKNAGKASFGYFSYSADGTKEQKMILIEPIKSDMNTGALVEDSEEVSNIIAYGMSIHASLIGSHGKSKVINGTEARELFIIKQAMLKPFRDRILKPFYLIKAINNWPPEIDFVIPNMELTTIDQGTGAKKVISQSAM